MSRSGHAPFWKIGLAPYVTWREVTIFTVVTIVANCAVQFQALLLPYLLSEQIGVAASDQGKVSGMLASVQQLATLVMLGFAGHLADRIGRRRLMIVTMAGYTACFFIIPLVSTVAMLIVVRILLGAFQAGHTAGGATRVVADYPDEKSRGRFISLTLVIQWSSVAIFVGLIGAKIPQWLVAAGLPTRLAGQVSFLIVAVLCALATLLSVTLSKNRAIDRGTLAHAEPGEGRFVRLSAIMQHARNNPRIMFVFLIGLVIRTDTSVVGAFLALWVINSAAESGIDAATATRTAGTLLTILSVASFATPPFFGYLADRINRVTLLLFGVVLTAVAFTSAIFVNDVTGWTIVFVVALIGFAEGAQTIAAQSMFGQEVPPHLRGSAMGVFAAMGTIMGLLITLIGGYLFDSVGYSAPFVLTGLLHFACFAIAVAILASRARKAFVSGQPGNGPVASQGPRNADRTITPDDF